MSTTDVWTKLPFEIARVRDQVVPSYERLGAVGAIALKMMRRDLAMAEEALAAGDLELMQRTYDSLKDYRT